MATRRRAVTALAFLLAASACGTTVRDTGENGDAARSATEPAAFAGLSDGGSSADLTFPYWSIAALARDANAIVIGRVTDIVSEPKEGSVGVVAFAVESVVVGSGAPEIRIVQPSGPVPGPSFSPVPMPYPLPLPEGRPVPMPMPYPMPEATKPAERMPIERVPPSVDPDAPISSGQLVPLPRPVQIDPMPPVDGANGNSGTGIAPSVRPAPLAVGSRYLLFLNREESETPGTFTVVGGFQGIYSAENELKLVGLLEEIRRSRP